jgi:hypothetical protein
MALLAMKRQVNEGVEIGLKRASVYVVVAATSDICTIEGTSCLTEPLNAREMDKVICSTQVAKKESSVGLAEMCGGM